MTDERIAGYLVTVGAGIGMAKAHAMLRGGLRHFDENGVIPKLLELADVLEVEEGDRAAAEAIRREVQRARGELAGAIEGNAVDVVGIVERLELDRGDS